jgi:hypothetical protein
MAYAKGDPARRLPRQPKQSTRPEMQGEVHRRINSLVVGLKKEYQITRDRQARLLAYWIAAIAFKL